jgi:sugar/nucleoside kinase (ribokinase family)
VDAAGYPTLCANPGGAPANFLAALNRYGCNVAMIGKVGEDMFGRLLLKTLKAAGIETRGVVVDPDQFTTLAFVTLDEAGDREFSFARKPGADTRLTFGHGERKLLSEARALHFGSLSLTHEPARTATARALDFARSRGLLISYDPNLRTPLWDDLSQAKEQLLWGMKQADVVKLSREEGEFLFDRPVEACAEILRRDYGLKLVFVTCGSDGCYFDNGTARGWEPALTDLRVADTTGAGDIFGGTALWGLLQTDQAPQDLQEPALRQIVRRANVAAGLSTTRPGGLSSVPDKEAIQAAMDAQQDRNGEIPRL